MSIGSVLIGAIALTATAADVVKPNFPAGLTLNQKPQTSLSSSSEAKQVEPSVTASKRLARLTAEYFDSEINVRSQPSTDADIVNVGYVGDTVEIIADRYSDVDSFIWYNVRLTTGNTQGWVRGDLVSVLPPSASAAGASASSAIAAPERASAYPFSSPSSSQDSNAPYSAAALDYFLEVAMGSEYGDATPNIRKWETDLRIQIMTPNATAQDKAVVEQVIAELNQLLEQSAGATGRPVTLTLVNSNPNVEMYFVPAESFTQYNSNAQEGQIGSAWMQVNNNVISGAEILIASNYLTDVERAHVIREELTQSLGIMKDSWLYEDSIFYQGWTRTNEYTALDREVIRMLYDPQLEIGMSQQQVASRLRR
jgi:Protein of unknown function (DUF2927)/Bacterial SH3 domain